MTKIDIVAIVLMVLISLLSFIMYRRNTESTTTKKITKSKFGGYIIAYIRISTLFFGIGSLLVSNIYFLRVTKNPTIQILGFALAIFGTFIFIKSKKELSSNYSHCFDSVIPEYIVKTGIYKYIRHPIYSSNLILCFSVFLVTGSLWLILNFCIMLFIYYKIITIEELALLEEFADYNTYKTKTWKLCPYVF